MADKILRNGVPHSVTTSLVTNNAVLPQNVFIQESTPALGDAGVGDAALTSESKDSSTEVQQPPSKIAPEPTPSYPVTKESLKANDPLTNIKSHIRDNIQALKNLAHSDNWQSAHEQSVGDNFQSVGGSRSIEEKKLYLEKKSIKSNRQLISGTRTERAAAHLASPVEVDPSGPSSKKSSTEMAEAQAIDDSLSDKQRFTEDSEFQMRVKNLKRHVRNVDSTLQDLDQDK